MTFAFALGLIVLLGVTAASRDAVARPYPKVFGTAVELPSKNFGKFPKWTDMLKRWEDGRAECETATCSNKSWRPLLEKVKGEDRLQQIKDVHLALNAKKYILDINNWNLEDYWATPYQFLKKNGDCEDYAIAKYMALKTLGVPAEDMRIIALQDLNLNLGHAVLIVYDKSGPLLLDNQIKTVVSANSIRHYKPVYAINELGWWLLR
jgi:predicted transglutaminase-like cysteine proteinase